MIMLRLFQLACVVDAILCIAIAFVFGAPFIAFGAAFFGLLVGAFQVAVREEREWLEDLAAVAQMERTRSAAGWLS